MKVSSELIRSLRAMTQAPMSACKAALEEAQGDLEKAVDIVKAKGLQQSKDRSGKITAEGKITVYKNDDYTNISEVLCQTDFTARSQEFVAFAEQVAKSYHSDDQVMFENDSEALNLSRQELIAKTGENIQIKRWQSYPAKSNSVVRSYIHSNNKLGVIAEFQASFDQLNNPALLQFADETCMQIAAMNPLSVSKDDIEPEQAERQRAIFETQLNEANKPPASWEKIIEGKFNKWHTEVCLLNQESVLYPKKTIEMLRQELSAQIGEVKILRFCRLEVGEGSVKKQEDLAKAVAETIANF